MKVKINLSDLTFRQYLALVYIFSKICLKGKTPNKEELKHVIGTKSDRMLDITLDALKRKGLIGYDGLNGNLLSISENARKLVPNIVDKLALIREMVTYSEFKKKFLKENLQTNSKVKLSTPQSLYTMNRETLKMLNNEKRVVHGWYNYLQDFSPSFVWEKVEMFKLGRESLILDPFVGCGTTIVTAKLMGINSIGVDVNPVAFFVSTVKGKIAWEVELKALKKEAEKVLLEFEQALKHIEKVKIKSSVYLMPEMELNQWLKHKTQNEVAYLKERIMEINDEKIRQVLLLALASSAVESSNVAFCPGTTFYPFRQRIPFKENFYRKINQILEDLTLLKQGEDFFGRVDTFCKDSREISEILARKVDLIITSPPYPNDLEYTRQTRLELYLLDFVKNMNDVQKIKRRMVKGSTKLIFKDSNSAKYVMKFESIQKLVAELEEAFNDKSWGWDYPRMIAEYFGDVYLTLLEFDKVMKKRGHALIVVGDQTYKNILIPVGKIVGEIAKDVGFTLQDLELLRVRRSTLHQIPLKEEVVIIRKTC